MPCYAYIHKKAAPCEDCFMKRMKAGENLSLTRYNAERKTWEHLRGEFIDWCGHPAFVQYIDDVTKSETLHRELENAEKRLEMVMDATGLSAWEYDSKRHTITYANSVFQNYGLPAVIEDVPQSLIPFVVPEDRPKLRELYQQLEEGRTPLSGDFQFLNRKTGSSSYLHTVYITTQDIDGEPVTYGACIDVTAQIQERKNYRSNVSALLEANPESLCAFQLNLTRNECIEGHGVSAFILEALRANTADAVLENIRNLIPSESERGVFAEKFDRVRLIKRFEQGIRLDHLDYRRCNEAQKIIWVRTFLNLLKDPETNEINCIIYSADITGQEETNCVLRIITGQEYQLVSIVDIESRSVTAKFIGEKVPEAYRRLPGRDRHHRAAPEDERRRAF